jgi:hypothetical protein
MKRMSPQPTSFGPALVMLVLLAAVARVKLITHTFGPVRRRTY